MKSILHKIIFLALTTFLITGCAINRKVDYRTMDTNLSKINCGNLAFALLDHRTAVVDGSRNPDYVGYTLSTVGIAYPMGTKSGNEFMQDLSESLAKSLENKGVETFIVQTTWTDDVESVALKLSEANKSKAVLLEFNELETTGYAIQVLIYDVNFSVYDKNGSLLTEKNFKGKRKIGGSVMWGMGKYKEYMPIKVAELFQEMFSDPKIMAALSNIS